MNFILSRIYGNVIIPTDFPIFQRGRSTTNQSGFSVRRPWRLRCSEIRRFKLRDQPGLPDSLWRPVSSWLYSHCRKTRNRIWFKHSIIWYQMASVLTMQLHPLWCLKPHDSWQTLHVSRSKIARTCRLQNRLVAGGRCWRSTPVAGGDWWWDFHQTWGYTLQWLP